MARGPSPLPAPPADLAGRVLPLLRLAAGSPLFRIHPAERAPLFFGPAPGAPPGGRFDSPSGRFRVLYAARSLPGAIAETLLRMPERRRVSPARVAERALARLKPTARLELVDLAGPGLSRLGLDARIASGPYEPAGAWAEALHAHPAAPDGLVYPSRLDPSQHCVALFDRAAGRLVQEGESVALLTLAAELGAVLDRYGKALDPG